jgi:hypothetical protein
MLIVDAIIRFLQVIVWPLIVLYLANVFRAQIAALIGRVSKVKRGQLEIDFDRKLEQIAEKVQGDVETAFKHLLPSDPNASIIYNLLDVDPLSAILAAWVRFSEAARTRLGDPSAPLNGMRLITELEKRQMISHEDAEILHMFRGLRKNAAHRRNTSVDPVTAEKVCLVLLQIAHELDTTPPNCCTSRRCPQF